MHFVYVLKSISNNWFYIGLTSNLEKRLKQHNSGGVKSTRSRRPFKIIYNRVFETRYEARNFEKYLKVRSNKEKLLRKLNYF